MTTITLLSGETREVEIPSYFKVRDWFYYKIVSTEECVAAGTGSQPQIKTSHAGLPFYAHGKLLEPCTESEFMEAYNIVEQRLREAIK